MKNKNQKDKNVFLWQEMSNKKKWILYVSLIFVIGIIFSWVVMTNLFSNVFLSSFYLMADDENSISMGARAAMIDDEFVNNNYRRIDGVEVESDQQNLIPYAVMIENLYSVRPQSGLQSASVVYESLVEGGATRFMAVFDPAAEVPEIMPVRSARQYYLEWSSEYGAAYAHAGGSPKALTIIREYEDIIDLEALGSSARFFWRDTSKAAPHNLVTSSEKMNFALRDNELNEIETDYQSWKFKDEAELADRTEAKQLKFNFSYGSTYEVKFDYNIDDNVYYRINANEAHNDKNTGQQIAVKNVVVQIVPEPVWDGGKGRLDINVGGTGKAWILLDGNIIEGSWSKESRTGRTLFYNSDGSEVEFNRGNTWIHILPETREVYYE
ncbi:MAG: DUF3048 domain-containing protein [bacterium]|nr:DUF3048 domain-containing protein [bacterium]